MEALGAPAWLWVHALHLVGEQETDRISRAGLDEPFLLVVVGEFNSGKSSVINALLGSAVLEEGILPTTNEISVLKHTTGEAAVKRVRAPPATGTAQLHSASTLPARTNCTRRSLHAGCGVPGTRRCAHSVRVHGKGAPRMQTEDGLYQRHLPAELLRKVNVVDTPGTNVIVERQQRLTEEFVPRSDLVLFILSADRPFTESEARSVEHSCFLSCLLGFMFLCLWPAGSCCICFLCGALRGGSGGGACRRASCATSGSGAKRWCLW